MRGVVSIFAALAVVTGAAAQAPPKESSLPDLVREALDRSPEIQMAALIVEAKRARVPQAAALPDPTLMLGVTNEGRPIPFQTLGEAGFSEAYLGISQDLPFAGKRRLRREVAQEQADAAEWALEGVRRRVAADVAGVYYDLYAVHAALDVVGESTELLERLIKAAHVRLSVGQTSQQDVLDAEVEMSRLEERRSELGQRRAVLEAKLSSLLNRSDGAPFGRPAAIAPTPIPGPLDELLRRAQEQSPALREKDRVVAQGERLIDLAKRDRKPDFSLNFTYHNRGGLDPYYSLGATLTLPNLYGRQKHALAEAVALLGSARGGADQARAEVRYAVTEAFQTASTAERLLRLYDEGILKQSRLSLDSALAQYQVGRVDFLTLITSWRRLLDYGLTHEEQLAAREKALARLAVHLGPAPQPKR